MHIVDQSPTEGAHSGLVVLEDFKEWDLWYQNKNIPLNLLPQYDYYPNMGVVLKGDGAKINAIVKDNLLIPLTIYHPQNIKPKNTEQAFSLNLLWDDSIPLVVLGGAAGSGKTLLSIAHGMEQVIEKQRFKKVIIAKSMAPVGREIGFLKGDLDDKILPWMGSFFDNMVQLGYSQRDLEEYVVDREYVELLPLTFIQGRSITDSIIIVDEAQNLDRMTIKQIVTRVGKGSKLILLGDPTQTFEKITKDQNGLVHVLDKARTTDLVGHIIMRKSVRSDLASWAVQHL